MKYKLTISIILIIASVYLISVDKYLIADTTMISRLNGKILLQVEDNGEAWYIHPPEKKRYYLGRPSDAFDIMRSLSVGITNNDLAKIPVAEANFNGLDTDGDGLSDAVEQSLGTDINTSDTDNDGYSDMNEILSNYNPAGNGSLTIDNELTKKMSGTILLQVEASGEAWYINPDDLKRYYLGRPSDAFNIMRTLGLGITNQNLAKIEEAIKTNPEFTEENIIKKYTLAENGTRKYINEDNAFSLSYPTDWNLKKYEPNPNITQITDAETDYIIERKGVISINHFKTNENIDVISYRTATKGNSKTLSDESGDINGKQIYTNSYEHFLAYEKTTTIQVGPMEFLQITLATAKYNDDYYIEIYDNLINSLEFN